LVSSRLLGLFLLFLALGGARIYAGEARLPSVALTGVPFEVTVSGFAPQTRVQVRLEDAQGMPLTQADAVADESGAASLRVRIPQAGAVRYVWQAGVASGGGTLRVIPAWWSLLPPLLAIALALLLRQVALALVGGVWLGAWLIAGGEPFTPLLRVVDTYLLDAYADRDHLQIVLFTLLLGGMLGIITRAGGLQAIVRVLSRRVRSDRGVQLSAYLLGLLIFIDDYANTLFVGATIRPLADRYRVSREKLAYLIDSTAAPVANLALVGTWIGFEVSVIADSFKAAGIALEPYWAFLLSLPYRFYPIFALAFYRVAVGVASGFRGDVSGGGAGAGDGQGAGGRRVAAGELRLRRANAARPPAGEPVERGAADSDCAGGRGWRAVLHRLLRRAGGGRPDDHAGGAGERELIQQPCVGRAVGVHYGVVLRMAHARSACASRSRRGWAACARWCWRWRFWGWRGASARCARRCTRRSIWCSRCRARLALCGCLR
jgi:hypothetical protein